MLEIRQDFLPKGHRNRPGNPMSPVGILIHTTNNWRDGAGDEMHGEYIRNTSKSVSWHVTVDKDSATQHLPFNENGWHAGDGANGHYNRNWIGLEIACEAVNEGEPLDEATYNNAVDVTAQIMMLHGWDSPDRIAPHRKVSGKNCPHDTLFSYDKFVKDVIELIKKRKDEQRTPFPDVPKELWSEKYILRAYNLGLINGYPDGNFYPKAPMTREEVATVIIRLYDLISKGRIVE